MVQYISVGNTVEKKLEPVGAYLLCSPQGSCLSDPLSGMNPSINPDCRPVKPSSAELENGMELGLGTLGVLPVGEQLLGLPGHSQAQIQMSV